MSPELWMGDDQMPSCYSCMNGLHSDCPDFIYTEPYGTHACGCTNAIHDEDEGGAA